MSRNFAFGFGKIIFATMLFFFGVGASSDFAAAADMPQASSSPLAGITFEDRPLSLPVQRNFQMAMLTASSELGRSCGKMEAYGWRLASTEQQRVNQIFNSAVDSLRAQGFEVESRSPSSVSRDVTLFTADRPDKHLLLMWSAGEIGLVMVLCETSTPVKSSSRAVAQETSMIPPPPNNLRDYSLSSGSPFPITRTGKKAVEDFSPVGEWVGTYTCSQGTTGGTLKISSLKGDQFEGQFRFYPTPKNPYVPSGRYTVYGEYDRDSNRILINPGKWLERPKNYYNTIIIGSFDPVAKTFSGYFQGINGCTSFEARYSSSSSLDEDETFAKAVKPTKKAKKKTRKTKPKETKPAAEKPKEEKQEIKTTDEKSDGKNQESKQGAESDKKEKPASKTSSEKVILPPKPENLSIQGNKPVENNEVQGIKLKEKAP